MCVAVWTKISLTHCNVGYLSFTTSLFLRFTPVTINTEKAEKFDYFQAAMKCEKSVCSLTNKEIVWDSCIVLDT